MEYQLLVVRGRSTVEALALVEGVTTVGRHDECHIRIKSSQVSRKHCEIFERKGMLLVKDLGSSNGTIVNGQKIDGQRVLEPGDELTLGSVTLRVAKIGHVPPARAAGAPGAGDTAVVAALSTTPINDDEFEIEFDDEPTVMTTPAPARGAADPTIVDSFEIPFEDEPFPSQPSEPKKEKAPAPKKAAKPEPAVAPAVADGADEAIADFLLDIKLEDDD